MPVEIRELVIRAVTQRQAKGQAKTSRARQPGADNDCGATVEATVAEVLRILARREER